MKIFTQSFFKKTLCLLCIMLSCLPGLADTTFTVGDWKYTTDGTNTCYVSKCNSTATSIEIPSSVEYNGTTYTVTSIGKSAFYSCSSLTNITIPTSVTSIGEYAFYGCSSLANVIIPNSVKSIGEMAFYECISITSITIPSSVTSIDNYAFAKCSSLTSVTIADRETELSIANGIFQSCQLESLYLGGDYTYTGSTSIRPFEGKTSLKKLEISNKVTKISDSEFYGCSSLENVIIPNSITSIGERAFYGCTRLKDMTIGNGTETVGDYAFSGCTALENLSFGTSLSTIGEEAFHGCTAMVKLVANAPVPPTCGTDALNDINKSTCTLYVPNEYIDVYKADEQWKEFFYINPTAVENIAADCNAVEVERYDLNGVRLNEPQRGINIVRMSDGTVRKVMVK